ncbi:hypothetical protein KDA_50570 [Dictyobacter alpinus]|uniref:Uncharacterized protein n=1 Tax=Dictyobacter alpinus TaxID=2014873 RepID=A0A402BDV9_9CHLR|nr:hypothetical protein [Dictyobacter alpinus]GCE29573.1 hypothetical protein KDA_50570 [Dictyobacter alpinus]
MMGTKERHFAPMTHISLEELVPQNYFYRSLEQKLYLRIASRKILVEERWLLSIFFISFLVGKEVLKV